MPRIQRATLTFCECECVCVCEREREREGGACYDIVHSDARENREFPYYPISKQFNAQVGSKRKTLYIEICSRSGL